MQEIEILQALKAIKTVYKDVLNDWLSKNLKEGIRYTYLVRPETLDDMGFTHLHERIYCPPVTIGPKGSDTDLAQAYDFLPFLTIRQMNTIFKRAKLPPVNWKHLATHWKAMDRLIDYINEEYREKHLNELN